MTFLDDVAADVDACLLTDFAASVTQYPNGNTGAPATVNGVFEFVGRELARERGKGWLVKGKLFVDTAANAATNDAWLLDGERWDVEAVDDAIAGLVTVHLQRYETQYEGQPGKPR
jgi:hypothetical protein